MSSELCLQPDLTPTPDPMLPQMPAEPGLKEAHSRPAGSRRLALATTAGTCAEDGHVHHFTHSAPDGHRSL